MQWCGWSRATVSHRQNSKWLLPLNLYQEPEGLSFKYFISICPNILHSSWKSSLKPCKFLSLAQDSCKNAMKHVCTVLVKSCTGTQRCAILWRLSKGRGKVSRRRWEGMFQGWWRAILRWQVGKGRWNCQTPVSKRHGATFGCSCLLRSVLPSKVVQNKADLFGLLKSYQREGEKFSLPPQ